MDSEAFKELIFGDFTNAGKDYIKIENMMDNVPKFNAQLEGYNVNNETKKMNLVFFRDAIQHMARISRILRITRGNALLIGVGGSGR